MITISHVKIAGTKNRFSQLVAQIKLQLNPIIALGRHFLVVATIYLKLFISSASQPSKLSTYSFSFSKSWCGAHFRCFVAVLKQNTGGVKRDDRGRYMIYAVLNYLLIFTDSVPCLCRSCNFGSFGFRPARSALLTPPEFEALRCLYFSSP